MAIGASAEVAVLSANRLGDFPSARDWVRIARASLDGHGRDDHLEGMVLTAEGMILASEGDLAGVDGEDPRRAGRVARRRRSARTTPSRSRGSWTWATCS